MNKLTIYNSDNDSYSTVEEPDPSINYTYADYLNWKFEERGCCGEPDLMVEILSPGNSRKEIKLKFDLYEEAGVKEYWIVYPAEESVAVFTLNESNHYDRASIYAGDDIIESNAVAGFSICLTDIFYN